MVDDLTESSVPLFADDRALSSKFPVYLKVLVFAIHLGAPAVMLSAQSNEKCFVLKWQVWVGGALDHLTNRCVCLKFIFKGLPAG